MLETVTREGSEQLLPDEEGMQVLRELAFDSFSRISSNQFPNGLIPASLGRHDDPHFDGKVWIKDHARAVRFALDPLVQQHLPEIRDPGKSLYLRAMDGILRVQNREEQLSRFSAFPGEPNTDGYSSIDDQVVPAIKFMSDGSIYYDWGHNQPDNWGTLLLEVGKGIKAGWPVLEKAEDGFTPGEVLQDIAQYVVNLRTERLLCRSIWEHGVAWPSYSTKRIVLAGLNQLDSAWPEIVDDSIDNEYQLMTNNNQIRIATSSLTERIREHQGDYTDSKDHLSPADLASLVVLNDVNNLPRGEVQETLDRTEEAKLENKLGFFRYLGDYWKHGSTEAIWTMGTPIMARFRFKQAINLYQKGHHEAGSIALNAGLVRMNNALAIIAKYGFMPELFEDEDGDGIFVPDNNELAWTRSYLIEAAAAGIAAIMASRLN